ncbi:hypothetical protein [Desulfovibrio sp. An276]|uniref:hypothetical protein n=1 Tax=Desulfovibrio sp. An276 TaxID=1965618 RepID=UPI0013A625C6|nr:hypothetical protein [Desulfovibrio sp. An276]
MSDVQGNPGLWGFAACRTSCLEARVCVRYSFRAADFWPSGLPGARGQPATRNQIKEVALPLLPARGDRAEF